MSGTGQDGGAAAGSERPRRPESVYGVGTEPDARFSLANERTALAWLRTGLALVAGGVALTTLGAITERSVLVDLIAALACLAGGSLAIGGLIGWRRTERSLRLGRPLPPPAALPILAAGIAVIAVLLAAYAVSQALS